jgi:hypothetical protein
MYEQYGNANETGVCAANSAMLTAGTYQPPTARRQLEQRKAALNAELEKVEAALAALDAHPELEAFTETLKAALR